MKIYFKILFCTAMLAFYSVSTFANVEASVAQQITVTGTVVEPNGEPIPGVAVMVKGTTTGTATEINGTFSLNVPSATAVLVFTYIGKMPVEQPIGSDRNFRIIMYDDNQELEEVVVIGYGTQAKKDLTGSIGTISQAKMENNATVGIGNNLQGRLAGVLISQDDGTPYGGVTIRIRGNGSFGASNNPIYIIDGMIANGGLSSLNPDDVENITVLKDAASAAIYGSRGANGVVIVTTKRGSFDSPVRINVNTSIGMDQIRKNVPTLTAKNYALLVNDYYGAANLPVPYSQEEINSYGRGTDWVDLITQNGYKERITLSLTGGSSRNAYAVTMNLYKGSGIVKNTIAHMGNIKVSNDLKILPNLKLGASLSVNARLSNNSDWGQAINRAFIFPATIPLYTAPGEYGTAVHAGEPVTMLNPMIAVMDYSYDQTWKRFMGDTFLEWEIMKGLVFKSSMNGELHTYYQDMFIPTFLHGPVGMIGDHPVAELEVTFNEWLNYEWDNILTWNKTFASNHNLTVMAGYTFQKYDYKEMWGRRTGFLNNDKNMQILSAGESGLNNSGTKNAWAMQSYLGRVNYDYQRKYLLSASLRIDETSRIAKENRRGFFPGASAGWVLSEESFMNKNGALSYLKLRASFGVLGNQDIGTYPYQTTLNSTSFYYPFGPGADGTTFTGVGPTSMGNRNLKWEKTSSIGAGLEANFFENRLTFITDFYKRNTSDILVRVPLLSTSGINVQGSGAFPYQNAGKCTNTGIEFTVGYSNTTDKKDFTYDVSVNWTYNVNKVTYIPAPIINNFDRVEEGQAINAWYGYVQDGIFQTTEEIAASPYQPNAAPGDVKYKDLDGDNQITSLDQQFLGVQQAPHFFGGNISLWYKNFDFVTSFYGQLGALRSMDVAGFAITRGGEQGSAWMYDQRWTGPGTSNYIPRVVAGDPNNNYRRSTLWLRSTDFFKVQNMQIGYNFNHMFSSKSPVKRLRFFIAAQNLLSIDTFPGWDPEQGITGFPIPRSFYCGINLGL